VGATYQATRPGPQAARHNSVQAKKVFPKRRPAASTRKRLLQVKTDDCGGFRERSLRFILRGFSRRSWAGFFFRAQIHVEAELGTCFRCLVRTLGEGTAMQRDLTPAADQLVEARALAVPARFTSNLTQLALPDQPGVLGRQKQEVFLDIGSELPQYDDLSDAGR
jgi:hypothetical protein